MTDRDTMLDDIQAAMESIKRPAGLADLQTEMAEHEARDQFQARMWELRHRLEDMQTILAHEDQYTLDKLAEAVVTAACRDTYLPLPHYEMHFRGAHCVKAWQFDN